MSRNMGVLIVILFTIYLASTFGTQPSVSKQYRSDYVYNKKTQSFYKLHIEGKRRWIAEKVCGFEGAKLMVPNSQQDVVQLHMMFKRYPDLGQFVLVGDDGGKHESAEEQPIINLNAQEDEHRSNTGGDCDVMTRKGDIETVSCLLKLPYMCKVEAKDAVYNDECKVYGKVNAQEDEHRSNTGGDCDVMTRKGDIETVSCLLKLPYMCKVEAKDAVYNDECKVYGKDYQYQAATGSCYKVSRVAMTWDQAYSECQHEGSHLVILNSETEHQTVWDLIKKEPAKVAGAKAHFFFFAGFRAERTTGGAPRVFRTILNDTLEEAGYSQWSEHEPNNYLDSEYCGSIFKNDGKFNDLACSHEYAFICEQEVHT